MKISDEQKLQLYKLKAQGTFFKDVAKELNCNYTLFISAVNGKRNLPDKYADSLNQYLSKEVH